MSNDRAKGQIPVSYLTRVGRVVLACILVAVAIWPLGIQPQATQAAPVYAPQTPTPPALPTPTPTPPPLAGEGAADQAPHTPPSPDNLPPEVEQARARQAIEAVLAKYVKYHGPRYKLAVSQVTIEGGWGYAVAEGQGRENKGESVHVLAHRQQDGTWQALLPDSDLYTRWVAIIPDILLSPNHKERLYQSPASPISTPETIPTPPPGLQPGEWIAGETPVSRLSREGRARLCGVPMEVLEWEREQARRETARLSISYSYPSSLDWRNFEGQDWTTPIRNQASCGSCVAFGTVAAIESRLEVAISNSGLNPDLSEAHLFYCGCGNCCGTGWSPSAALNFARDTGIVDEACYPYTAYNQPCNPCAGWQSRVTRISRWEGISSTAGMKQALADFGPLEATMIVYQDFFSYSGGIYRHIWGDVAGGHAVTIVGYNDVEGYWIVKNSWGPDWGESGWFRIAYEECGIDDYAYIPIVHCDDAYELNNTSSQAKASGFGQIHSAYICPAGDYDYYVFTGTAGQRIVADVDAMVNGSYLDSYLTLFDSDGTTVLAEHDDEILGQLRDAHLGYQLPHDGTYYLRVRAWDHPSVGGMDYFYTIKLLTDNTNPRAEITSPGNDAWLDPGLERVTASASDGESGISHVTFLWHDADWENSDWVWLGEDWDGSDGWTWDFDTSGLAEQRGGAFYIWAFDWAGNWTGAGTWNLGIDRTPPTVSAGVQQMYGDAPFLDFWVTWWDASDNLSGIANYDVQYRDGSGGTWTDLLTGTTDTCYRFVGQDGHTYYFRVCARDNAGNQSTYASGDGDVQHTVQICATLPDAHEPDNSHTAARTITTDGTWQSHNFHAARDQDWVKFTATAGITYTLVTTNTGGHADTVLYLYKSDGNTLIDSNDDDPDNWPASRLQWGATRGGTYYVKVEHWDPHAYGCTTVYGLSIVETGTFEVSNKVYLPVILRNVP